MELLKNLIFAWELHSCFSPTLIFQTDQHESQHTDQHQPRSHPPMFLRPILTVTLVWNTKKLVTYSPQSSGCEPLHWMNSCCLSVHKIWWMCVSLSLSLSLTHTLSYLSLLDMIYLPNFQSINRCFLHLISQVTLTISQKIKLTAEHTKPTKIPWG